MNNYACVMWNNGINDDNIEISLTDDKVVYIECQW